MRSALLLITAAAIATAADSTSWADSLGAKLDRNPRGEVTRANFRASWITDADLAQVAQWKQLESLDLSLTRVTDP